MSVGTYISGVAHMGIVAWLALGWGLDSRPMDMSVTEVSIISGAAFDQALRAGTPMAEVENSPTPVVDDAPVPAPDTPAAETAITAPAPQPRPAQIEAPDPTPAPTPDAPAQAAPPAPPAVVQDAPPHIPEAPVAAPAPNFERGTSPRPKPRAVQRLAPVAAAAPSPDAIISDSAQQATRPDTAALTPAEPVQQDTAPEEAATEVVTEAEKPSFAPEISLRPQARRPRPKPAPAPEPATDPAPAADPVAAALAAAMAASDAPQQGSTLGTSMTSDEIGSFLGQIGNCWYIETASTDAQKTTVSLMFELTQDGMVVPGSIARAGYTGGDANAAEIAYRVAEQAVTECQTKGRSGYDLPAEKFPLWQQLKIRFNPETMRLR